MEKTMSGILVGTIVKKTLRDMKDSPERSVRNLVDLALQFSSGRFQQHFFGAAQTMLQNENSGYYRLIRDTMSYADIQRLYTFSMNLGYHGCTVGAHRIRENEQKLGQSISWVRSLEISASDFAQNEPEYQRQIYEGEELGIYVWTIFTKGLPHIVLPLANHHPDSAFILFCGAGDITPAFLDIIRDVKNVMIAVRYDENTDSIYSALRSEGIIYSTWYPYGQDDIDIITDGDLFYSTQQFTPVFTFLLPKPGCPDSVQALAHQAVERFRKEQIYSTVPWEMRRDVRMIDDIISDGAYESESA